MGVALDRRLFLLGASSASLLWYGSGHRIIGAAAAAEPLPETGEETIEQRFARRFSNALFLEARKDPVEPALVRSGRPIIILGQEVTVDGSLETGGQSLAIIARKIMLRPGARIITDGLKGSPDFLPTNRALDGKDLGEAGRNGAAGGRGKDAADVVILCEEITGKLLLSLNGGAGGVGQGGGNGMRGKTGPKGKSCTDGGIGYIGGSAGAGGPGGSGGFGGIALIQSHQTVDPGQIDGTAAGGAAGAAGSHGTPGAGGDGGPGGPAETSPAEIH